MERLVGFIGIALLVGIAAAMSTDRRRIPWKLVGGAIALQFALALLLLKAPVIADGMNAFASGVAAAISAADAGSTFIFGPLASMQEPWGFVFAFQVLPLIIFFASLMAVLYHVGVMQRVVFALAWVLRRTLGVTGTEALAVSANVVIGQTEAPLCVRPYIPKMSRSQLMVIMCGGFATIAGSVLAAYVRQLGGEDPAAQREFATHLITASLMSAPAAFMMAKILVPETEEPVDAGLKDTTERDSRNVLDAAAVGATDGLRLALNVGAMLVAFVAILALVNAGLGWISGLGVVEYIRGTGAEPLSLQLIFGYVLSPLAWSMGVSWADAGVVGSLLGEKIVLTEFIAYLNLAEAIQDPDAPLDKRSGIIATYALCGFANFPSIAIQIGGLSALAPERRSDLASLGLRAMFGGAFASWMTASVAGIVL